MTNIGRLIRCSLVALAVLCGASFGSRAENWPQWRGPQFNGSTTETSLPSHWSTSNHVAWVNSLPGRSGATPVLWDSEIFVVTPDADKGLWLYCFDEVTGKLRWKTQGGVGDHVEGKNNMASCSPVTDGKTVWALFGTSDLIACDFAGKALWHRKLSDEFGAFADMFQYGGSPLLHGGKLYLAILQNKQPAYAHSKDGKPDRQSYLVCLDPADGRTIWKKERLTDAHDEAMEAYTTPIPHDSPRGIELIVSGANCVTAHDPASGAENWRYPGINVKRRGDGRVVPSPVSGPGLVFACGPKRETIVAIQDKHTGLLATNALAWSSDAFIPDASTPLYYQDRLYVLDGDRQMMTCYQPKTGEKFWQSKLPVRETFYSSPTGADGKIYCLSEAGTVVILSAGDHFKVLDTIAMGEGPCMSSVVAAGGYILIRTAQNLYAIK